MAHALTEAASTVVLILLATWVAGRPIVGMLAGLCFSLYPEAIRRTPGPATEPWFTFLLLLLCCALLWLFDNHTWRRAAVCGCLIGLMSLTRPSFQFFPIFLAGVIMLRYRTAAWSAMRSQAVSALAFAMVVMPWTVRNYRVTGQFIPVTTQGPSDLYLGTQIEYGRDFFDSREVAVARRLEVGHELEARGGGVDVEHRFLTLALNEIRSRPLRYARSVGHRLLGFWYLTQTRLGAVKNLAEHVPIYALAAFGFVGLIGRRRRVLVLLLPLVYLNAVHGMTHALIRYALPVMPIVFLLAAQGLVELEARISEVGR